MSNSGQKPVFQPQQDAFANHVEGLRSFAETYAKSTLSRDRSMAGATKLIRKIDMMVDREIDLIHDGTEALAKEGKGHHFG